MAEFITRDGQKLYYECWRVEEPRACIQILTGLGEMAWYYREFAEAANLRGFSVYLHEYRGHGRSNAAYGKGNLFLGFASDAADMLRRIRGENPDRKVFLLCHSLGTGVAQFATALEKADWDAIAMTGPSHRVIDAGRLEQLLAMAETAIHRDGPDAPSAEIYPEIFDGQNDAFAEENSPFSFITSDREKWEFIASLPFTSPAYSNRFFRDFVTMQGILIDALALEKQPFRHAARQSGGAGRESGTGFSDAISSCRMPVFLLTGEDDVTSEHGTYAGKKAERLREAGFPDVTVKVYKGLRHSILQETRREEVVEDILSWMEARIG